MRPGTTASRLLDNQTLHWTGAKTVLVIRTLVVGPGQSMLVRYALSNMKRREMNSLARSLCAFLSSRNNDIAGYWGIGMLCAASKREAKPKFSFKIYPGQLLKIYGCEITDSKVVTDKLLKFGLDSIEGRLSFFEDGRYPDGAEKYTCGIAIAITQGGRTGLSLSHIECWPHNPSRERRRAD